jgi:TMEM175 potassium channel family protein
VSKTRLEAFTDGVIAIIITIMVLEVRTPHGTTWAALRQDLPVLLAYVLSFVLIGIYWNNHHHMLAAVTRISGMTLWANQHLLFWLSLIPVATAWMSENHFPPIPVAAYGVVLLAASLAYSILQAVLLRIEDDSSVLAAAIGTDVKGRASPLMYGLGIGLSFADRWLGIAAYTGVALIWLIPDRRVERALTGAHEDGGRIPP